MKLYIYYDNIDHIYLMIASQFGPDQAYNKLKQIATHDLKYYNKVSIKEFSFINTVIETGLGNLFRVIL